MKRSQQGLTTVEFSIVATLLMILLFGVIEFGRLMYTFAVLGEGTRRAARLAAVCPIGSPNINTADFANLPRFGGANLSVLYLDAAGFPTVFYNAISYVQVQVVDYRLPLAIPFVDPTVVTPSFRVTLPRESLGVSNTDFTPCG